MKKYWLALIGCFFSTICLASDYNVSGHGGRGYYYGEIESSSGTKDVEGYLYDENGNSTYFSGEWSGRGEIEGYNENGDYIQLEVE